MGKRACRSLALRRFKNYMHRTCIAKRFDKYFTEHYSQRQDRKGFRSRLNTIKRALHGDTKADRISMAGRDDDHRAHIRTQLESIHIYRPWFMYVMTALQVIVTTVSVIAVGTARIGVRPTKLVSGG